MGEASTKNKEHNLSNYDKVSMVSKTRECFLPILDQIYSLLHALTSPFFPLLDECYILGTYSTCLSEWEKPTGKVRVLPPC